MERRLLPQSLTSTLIIAILGLGGCATSPSITHAFAQYNKQNYREAFQEMKSIAESGSSTDADLNLSYLYALGIGTSADIAAAKTWAAKAAAANRAGSECMLGDIAEWLEHDPAGALAHYNQAAELGNRNAYVDLAYIYDRGIGVAADKTLAQAWLEKLLDPKHPVPAEFLEKAGAMVADAKTYPASADMMRRYGSVTVSFHYVKVGQASDVRIVRSYGSLSNDLMALQSTYMARMPQPPEWALAKGISEYSYVLNVQMGPSIHQ